MNMRWLTLFMFAIAVPALRADTWAYPTGERVYHSANGECCFRTIAPIPKSDQLPSHAIPHTSQVRQQSVVNTGDSCLGILEKQTGDTTIEVWKKHLVNPVEPLSAIITDDGRYVITFDTWFGVGTDPIVVYGDKGDLIKRHTLNSLGLTRFTEAEAGSDEPLITRSISSNYWNKDALIFLSDRQDAVIVRMYWGYVFAVHLSDGSLLSERDLDKERPFVDGFVKVKCRELLSSKDADERRQGAVIAGTGQYTEFIGRLKELLEDPANNEGYTLAGLNKYTGSFREYYVREAALNALKAMGKNIEGIKIREDFSDPKVKAEVEKRPAAE